MLNQYVELIKTINRFEHGVSYSKFLEINTAFVIQKLAESESRIALSAETQSNGAKYSRMYRVKFFKGCLPQIILLGPF